MENRLCLNKRPVYELPDEVLVGEYRRGVKMPNFEPNICINTWGDVRVKNPEETVIQLWIKTENKELLEFIKVFNFEDRVNRIGNAYRISKNNFKKIILEEFYGVKYGK